MILGIIFTALIIIGVFSVLILVHECGHFIAARRAGVKVERFALGFGKKLFAVRKGDTEYAVNLVPLGGYVKLAGEDPAERKGKDDELGSKNIISRFFIFFSGSFSNFIFAFFVLILIYLTGTPMLTGNIGMVLKDSPAERAGLMKGDRIISIDGNEIRYWEDIVRIVRSDKDAIPLNLTIEREEGVVDLTVIPSVIETKDIFNHESKYVGIGVAPSEDVVMVKSNPVKAVYLAYRHVRIFTLTTYKGLWLMITGGMPVKENVGGPIRIVEVLAKSVEHGPVSVFLMMATISLALAIFNMLPFPVLDGGHILFLLIEKLRGKPLSVKTQETVTQAAFLLLITFVLYVSYFDVTRVVSDIHK